MHAGTVKRHMRQMKQMMSALLSASVRLNKLWIPLLSRLTWKFMYKFIRYASFCFSYDLKLWMEATTITFSQELKKKLE